jgi:hypothetical protein
MEHDLFTCVKHSCCPALVVFQLSVQKMLLPMKSVLVYLWSYSPAQYRYPANIEIICFAIEQFSLRYVGLRSQETT